MKFNLNLSSDGNFNYCVEEHREYQVSYSSICKRFTKSTILWVMSKPSKPLEHINIHCTIEK